MPLFNVHVYTIVRVEVKNIEAPTAKEAAEFAATTNFYELLRGENYEWAEQHESYLVDPLYENGEVDYDHPEFFLDKYQVAAMRHDLEIGTEQIPQGDD